MAKRFNNFNGPSNKKTKFDDEELDDWDDVDPNAIDECFLRASQSCQDVESGNSKKTADLSSYSFFKKPNEMFTSTQASEVPDKIKDLEDRYIEKEGEVSILRLNIHDLRASSQINEEKKSTEYKEKLNLIEKEKKSFESEIAFKNLEIANLKRQITDLSKMVNVESNGSQVVETQKLHVIAPKSNAANAKPTNFSIYVETKVEFPLKNMSYIVEQLNELLNNEASHETAPDPIEYVPRVSLVLEKIESLINFSSIELITKENISTINEIIIFSFQLLTNFYASLTRFERERHSITFHTNQNRIKKLTICCALMISFLTKLLPCYNDLVTILMTESPNYYNKQFEKLKLCKTFFRENKIPWNFCCILIGIVEKIQNMNLEESSVQFFVALITFLRGSLLKESFENNYRTVYETTLKSVLELKFSSEIILELSYLLVVITEWSNLFHSLCSQDHSNGKKGCRLDHYFTAIGNMPFSTKSEQIYKNIMKMSYNILKANTKWADILELKRCKCLNNLFKLTLKTVYTNLESADCERKLEYLKVLYFLTFNVFDLTQKYVTDVAQLRSVLYTLNRKESEEIQTIVKRLERFCGCDEDFEVSREKFENLNF